MAGRAAGNKQRTRLSCSTRPIYGKSEAPSARCCPRSVDPDATGPCGGGGEALLPPEEIKQAAYGRPRRRATALPMRFGPVNGVAGTPTPGSPDSCQWPQTRPQNKAKARSFKVYSGLKR